jgi:hypothetical protein
METPEMMTPTVPTEDSPVSNAHPISRRRVLQLAGAGTASALAGCAWILPDSTATVIEDTTFQGTSVVVHLPDDTDADAIDLRSPSDELLHTASIGRQSTVSLPLYLSATNSPRSPGEYTLVAVATSDNGESQTLDEQSLSLTSAFTVREIRPVSDPQVGTSFPFDAKVQLTIKNTGTLPLMIDYIGFTRGVPKPTPPPSQTDGTSPDYRFIAGEGFPIPIGGTPTFESGFAPLWTRGGSRTDGAVGVPKDSASWQQVKTNHCNGEQYPASLVIESGQGPTHRLTVTFKYAGTAARKGSYSTDYGCTNVTVTSIDRKPTRTSTPQ